MTVRTDAYRFTALALIAFATSALASDTTTYEYDALGRLRIVDSRGANGAHLGHYDYDSAGNRTQVTVSGAPVRAILPSGQVLRTGQVVQSNDGRFILTLQPDQNVVLYDQDRVPLWNAYTVHSGGKMLAMQADGNLVLYDGDRAIWHTSTHGHWGAFLAVQDDGNLVVYRQDWVPLWTSGTCCR